MSIDQARYRKAKEEVMSGCRSRKGIGTLSEKTIHAVLKNYYEPDKEKQEVRIFNLVADIFTGKEIVEIQTRNFYPMKRKLKLFLSQYPVTLIYPLPYKKWVIWIDEETGKLSKKRKSPKTGSPYDAFRELYKIKEFIGNDALKIKLVFLDMEEYRLLNGWSRDKKRGSHRYDRIPLDFIEEKEFSCAKDYQQLIPHEIEEPFDVKGFAKAAKIKQDRARQVLYILLELNQVERVGKKGNAYLYRVKED